MKVELSDDHITEYERAVCYYTLPKVVGPITYGLVFAYAVCLIEAFSALMYGLSKDDRAWTTAGASALGGIVLFGMLVFTARALLNDWNRRAALAAARHVPDAEAADDIPNPFAEHILLQRPLHVSSEMYACVTSTGTIEYYVEVRRNNTHWRVSTPQDKPLFDVLAEYSLFGVGIFRTRPVRLGVYVDKKKVASVVRRNTLRTVMVDIFSVLPEVRYNIKAGCIYFSERLVGRIYVLRGHIYLDIEREHAIPGIVAHFVTME